MNGESLRLPAQVTASCITPPAVWAVRDRLEESETLQQQAQNNSLAQFSASPDLQNEFVGAVIGAMDSHTDLSTQILNNAEILEADG